MTIRARLYDAHGEDRDIDLAGKAVRDVDDRRLLWVDLDSRTEDDLRTLQDALGLEDRILVQLRTDGRRARILRFPERIVITLGALERDDEDVARAELDVIVGRNLVVTVHEGSLTAIDDFNEQLGDEESLGELDAGAFMTALVDSVLTGYFREIDDIERRIEALDQVALQSGETDDFLRTVVALRRRIAVVRRALTPNRDALTPIVRPDFEVHEDLVRAWPGTIDRLERAIDAADKVRELLVGSFDIYLGRSAQRSNDVMKILTLVSAIALPGIVLAGVMGMNFQLGFFDESNNFFVVTGAMVLLALAVLWIAHWRRWF
ncbi:MAG TPA: CorA family divalent cation transporter [Candidatus Limnocylindrales bacterium]|nr:CorA family divalent cation transporter [Candidatus Limnocylindrales bacterium]